LATNSLTTFAAVNADSKSRKSSILNPQRWSNAEGGGRRKKEIRMTRQRDNAYNVREKEREREREKKKREREREHAQQR
jgi:hypothetical protein